MKSSVFVTGGNGFIGTTLCESLKKKFYVVNIDNNTLNSKFKINHGDYNYNFSIGNVKKIERAIIKHKPKYIFNLAAQSHVDNSIKNPLSFIKNNILETVKFLDIVRKNLFKLNKNFKFIHMSTDEVYGSIKKNSKKVFNEKSNLEPNSPYSSSKASVDLIINSYIKTFNFPAIIVRSSNNFGPYQHYEKLIPKIIFNSLSNKKIPIYAKGNQIREWLFVEDTVDYLKKIAIKGKLNEIYNIGSSIRLTNIELTHKILKYISQITKNDLNLYHQLISHVKDRPGHDFKYAISTKKITKIIKLNNKKNFDKQLKKTINWYFKIYKKNDH